MERHVTMDGETYTVTRFPGGAYVLRSGVGHERHAVCLKPAMCDCGDFIWRREGLLPTPCRHVRAARLAFKQETNNGCPEGF